MMNSHNKKFLIVKERLLIVEGKDEEKFFEAYINVLKIDSIQIFNAEGKNNFRNVLESIKLQPNFSNVKKYAIVRDADASTDNAFKSVRDLLKRLGQPVPKEPGVFAANGTVAAGVFIMPGNADSGMLEDLCLRTARRSPVLACADAFLACVSAAVAPEEIPKNQAKARLRAFLAGQPEPAESLGVAAQKGCFDFNSGEFAEIKNFLLGLAA
jgi:hypothetical protein